MAIGLLLVSSSVSLSIPFTIGKLIDFFASTNPVRLLSSSHFKFIKASDLRNPQQIPYGLSLVQASALMLAIFTIGAGANAGRSILMRLSGQRIVARLRQNTYASALQQEVEYVEKGEGDVLSRLSVDSSIVGES